MQPTTIQVKDGRAKAGLTQTQAANVVHATHRAWQRWEAGDRAMSAADWELFQLKTGIHPTQYIAERTS